MGLEVFTRLGAIPKVEEQKNVGRYQITKVLTEHGAPLDKESYEKRRTDSVGGPQITGSSHGIMKSL